jgi:hypothetical protein
MYFWQRLPLMAKAWPMQIGESRMQGASDAGERLAVVELQQFGFGQGDGGAPHAD